MATIAVIEPDADSAGAIAAALRADGHHVVLYPDGQAALAAFRAAPPDLVLSPLRRPGVNGLEVLRLARKVVPCAVVLVSPVRDEVDEMIALKLGADDFLGPMPAPAVVAARVEVVLRRSSRVATPPRPLTVKEGSENQLRYGGLTFEHGQRSCDLDGHPVPLTSLESVVLGALMSKPGAVLSRGRLTDLLYGLHADMEFRIVDSHIKRLRTKFRAISPHFDPIETIYRGGYRLRAPAGDAGEGGNPPNSQAVFKDSHANSLTPSDPS